MAKSIVAIDVGSYSIKAIQATMNRKLQIVKATQTFNSVGLSMPTDDQTTEQLAKLIETVFSDNSLSRTDVRLSLEESLVSTKIISIPPLTDAELASAITWQAEQHIPIPLDELSLEYQVLFRPPRSEKHLDMRVLLVGARKNVVEKYLNMFLRLGIEPTVLETQTVSILRSLQFTTEDSATLVVHMGAYHTDISIVDHGELRFVYTFESGGQAYTRTIEQAAQMDAKQAEEYKRAYGIDQSQLQGTMREILLPAVRSTILEIQKAQQFFLSQKGSEPIKRILLSGGSSQLPGLVQYVTEQLGMEVLVASPFAGAEGVIPATDHPAFTVCMGLLLRDV